MTMHVERGGRRACRHGNDPEAAGGLAGWQVRRLRTFIGLNLDQPIRVRHLGAVVQLSASHFARVFKKAFGETPHSYLVRCRLDHAKHLLISGAVPLSEVALSCGFADQAHLCRTFGRFVGQSPAAWRNARSRKFNGASVDRIRAEFAIGEAV
jgi:AraC family transcriptional regulator